ncbi:MAG: hypothetical protein ACE366_29600 [Bradymonadia bacterium]
MSHIQIEVPLQAMGRPGVAQALSDLMHSLGQEGHEGTIASAPSTSPSSRSALLKQSSYLQGGAHSERKPRRKPRRSATTQQADLSHLPHAERWAKYLTEVPEPTRRFVEILEEKGELTVDEAVEALGLNSPKAMGGLTGAMRRWAPQRGVVLPFEGRQRADGTRCWVWIGLPAD